MATRMSVGHGVTVERHGSRKRGDGRPRAVPAARRAWCDASASTVWRLDRLDRRHLHAQPGHRARRRGRLLRGALAAAADLRARRRRSATSSSSSARRQVERRAQRRPRLSGQALTDADRRHRSSSRPSTTCSSGGRFDVISIGFVLALWSGSRALNVFVDTITIMYGLGGHRGIVKTRALSFLLYVLAMVTGVVTHPAGGRRPDAWSTECAAGPARLPQQLLLADRAACSASASWPRSTTCRCRCGPRGASTCPARSFTLFCWVVRLLPAALGPHGHRRGLDARSTARWPRRSRCCSGSTCSRSRC